MQKQITVQAAATLADLDERGPEVEYGPFDTLKAAKARAQYYLTEDYRQASEASERLGYAQVLVDGDVRYDFFARKEGK